MKIAIVTGATGQDGSYMCEFLLEKGYEVRCPIRRTVCSLKNSNVKNILNKIKIYECDMIDQSSMFKLFEGDGLFEIYNLAAQSQVGTSFNCPKATFEINTMGTLNILDTILKLNIIDRVRFYQASTSEMFGKVQIVPQNETTPFYPRSPYGVSKLSAHWIMKNYRESYNMFACSGILFNHESPRRGDYFITQKIVKGMSDVFDGKQDTLYLGNIDARRDWGHAKDYVEAMWLILQQDEPNDYVVATGKQCSVREFIEKVGKQLDIHIIWEGTGLDEIGKCKKTGKVYVKISKQFYRPCEVDTLIGDSSKIEKIGWKPKYNIDTLVMDMLNNYREKS